MNNMKLKRFFKECIPFLLFLAFILYEVLSGMGAFSGRLGITLALKQSESGYIYLEEPFEPNGTFSSGSTNQHYYQVYQEKGATDVVILDTNHHIVAVIAFADLNKGSVGLTCTENSAHVHLRNGQVAVLKGSEVTEILSAQEANTQGIEYYPTMVHATPLEAGLTVFCVILFIILFIRGFRGAAKY